jgi:heavy metal translocating P-type ATPase
MNVMMIALLFYTRQVDADAAGFFRWLELVLALPAAALLGYPMAVGAVREMIARQLSLDSLIITGVLAATGTSAWAVISGHGELYFDTATMLLALVTFGRLIEATARSRARNLTDAMASVLPRRALVPDGAGRREVPVEQVQPGDRVLVLTGQASPVDGTVIEGAGEFDESALTGESAAQRRGFGEPVMAGAVLRTGPVVLEASRTGNERLVEQIAAMVEHAWQRPSAHERLAQRAARWFTPLVLVVASATFAGWCVAQRPAEGLLAALAVLVVACPCAMGIAAPLATALSIGRAAREGVLVRGGDVMESAGNVKTMLLDKTGTLTRPAGPAAPEPEPGVEAAELLACLGALEARSEHPLSAPVLAAAGGRGLSLPAARNVRATPGLGLEGEVEWQGAVRRVRAGTGAFVGRGGPCARAGVCVAWDGQYKGFVPHSDELRSGAAEAVKALEALGVRTVLVTGDAQAPAKAVADKLGISRVLARCTPDGKLAAIEAARRDGPVAMVGDGVNDAPALALADVGIAVGDMELARQSSGASLVRDSLALLPWLVALGRRTRRVIRQNLLWALGYNSLAIAAAAAGWLHPLLAAVLMVVSSLTVLGNSCRLARDSM